MDSNYPGLPSVARKFWGDYLLFLTALSTYFLFIAAAGGLIMLLVIPEGSLFYLLGAGSLVLHMTALYHRDVWNDKTDPNQQQLTSFAQILIATVILGVYVSSILLFATAIAVATQQIVAAPMIVGAFVAAYYPVVDLVAMRHGHWTPGGIAMMGVVVTLNTILGIRESLYETLPIIGTKRRPS